jgi:hypothetical protein
MHTHTQEAPNEKAKDRNVERKIFKIQWGGKDTQKKF